MIDPVAAPVQDAGPEEPEDEVGLALSGGGYRAMLFHAGTFVRLFETGLLARAARVSSVSGGSIAAAKLALEWPRLADRATLMRLVVEPLQKLASVSIDVASALGGLTLPGTAAARVAAAYRARLFGDATLQGLPERPIFIINATNVETGSLWRFSRRRARDWRVGEITSPRFALADAVAASSAFPPVLSPFVLDTVRSDFSLVEPGVDPALLHDISLTDGGVYDNLGLEAVYKRCRTLLVSDGGAALATDPSPASDWLRHSRRVLDVIHNQVSSVRTRQLIDALERRDRLGAYWSIRGDIADFALSDALPAPYPRTRELAATPTRLKRMDRMLQERLINWGYAACDAAVRRWAAPGQSFPPPAPPYPSSPI